MEVVLSVYQVHQAIARFSEPGALKEIIWVVWSDYLSNDNQLQHSSACELCS